MEFADRRGKDAAVQRALQLLTSFALLLRAVLRDRLSFCLLVVEAGFPKIDGGVSRGGEGEVADFASGARFFAVVVAVEFREAGSLFN